MPTKCNDRQQHQQPQSGKGKKMGEKNIQKGHVEMRKAAASCEEKAHAKHLLIFIPLPQPLASVLA